MGIFATIIVFASVYLLQTTFVDAIAVFGIKPDLILAALICFAGCNGKEKGALAAAIMGIVADLLFGKIFGAYTLLYVYIVVASGFVFEFLFEHNIITVSVTTLVLCAVGGALCCAIRMIGGQEMSWWFVIKTVCPTAFYTALAALVLYPLIAKICRRYEIV